MPSSMLRHLGNQLGQPIMQPAFAPSYRPNEVLISPLSWCALGDELTGITTNSILSGAYPATSRVLAFPFEIAEKHLVQKVWWVNGATATTDSADVGVYSEAGTTLHVSGGSTAIATANVMQEKDCTDTLLVPGRYWCAYVQGGVTATPMEFNIGAPLSRAMGWAQMAGSGSTLGATFTPAAIAGSQVPLFGIAARVFAA